MAEVVIPPPRVTFERVSLVQFTITLPLREKSADADASKFTSPEPAKAEKSMPKDNELFDAKMRPVPVVAAKQTPASPRVDGTQILQVVSQRLKQAVMGHKLLQPTHVGGGGAV